MEGKLERKKERKKEAIGPSRKRTHAGKDGMKTASMLRQDACRQGEKKSKSGSKENWKNRFVDG